MTIRTTLAAAAAATMIANSAMAGGFLAAETEVPIVQIAPAPVAAAGSLPGWVIPAVIVAALVGVAVASDDS